MSWKQSIPLGVGVILAVIAVGVIGAGMFMGDKGEELLHLYGDYKAKQGFGSKPQLSVSNQMLGDIQISVLGERRAELFFGSRLSAAKAHGHDQGKYPFFGVRPEEAENLHLSIARYLKAMKAVD